MQVFLVKMHTSKSDLNGIHFPTRLVLINVPSRFAMRNVDVHLGFNSSLPPGQQVLVEDYPCESCVSPDVEIVKVVEMSDDDLSAVTRLRDLNRQMYEWGASLGRTVDLVSSVHRKEVKPEVLDDYTQFLICRNGADVSLPPDCQHFNLFVSGAEARRRK